MSSSILTNNSAMAALQTLRSISEQLDSTQNQISSGLRVGSASDNAAYWSIATTMKSDNQALSAVSDSLGLGSSTVDVAYTALNSTITTLNDIKSRLVTAQQPGVDKSKIQSEISSLQQTLKSTADSANFSGSNFLSIDSSKGTTQSVVASFTRDSSGAITLGTIAVDTSKVALFDSSATGAGLLEKSLGNTSAAGMAAADVTGAVTTAATHGKAVITSALSYTNGNGSGTAESLVLAISVDGGTAQKVSINLADGAVATTSDLATKINEMFANNQLTGFSASVDGSGNLTLTSDSLGTSSSIAVTVDASNGADVAATTAGTTDLATTDTETAGAAEVGSASTTKLLGSAFSGVTLDKDDTISFNVAVDGGTAKTVTIDRATVDQVLGTTDGKISNVDDMSAILNRALRGTGVTTASDGTDITFTTATGKTGSASSLTISNVKASAGANDFDLMSLDITNATSDQISGYINGIDKMIQGVTTAASDLGATKTQITNQSDFLSSLMNSIDKGVGTLVDADMNEASTKLKALQTQQQLGIQALSIANSNSQNILSLFR